MRESVNLNAPVTEHLRREFTTVRADSTVEEAFASLRGRSISSRIVYFYATDADGKLLGVVPTRRLIMAALTDKISDIMVTQYFALPENSTILDAFEAFLVRRYLALPVVDADKRIIGVLDIEVFADQAFDAASRPALDDVFQMIGLHVDEATKGSVWSRTRRRFPWLMCNIGSGVLCAMLAALYEPLINAVIILALFIPVVLALAESVSMQAATITLYGLRQQGVKLTILLRQLKREVLSTAGLGIGCGAIVGTTAWVWKSAPAAAAAIGIGICLSIMSAGMLGVLLPTLVHASGRDPSIASGPIVLATADVATMLLYLNAAALLL